jgi:hypothetical protein
VGVHPSPTSLASPKTPHHNPRTHNLSRTNALDSRQFLSEVGPVTSSVMNTAKRVIVIIACAIIFGEKMDRNAKLGAAIAVSGKVARH